MDTTKCVPTGQTISIIFARTQRHSHPFFFNGPGAVAHIVLLLLSNFPHGGIQTFLVL